MPRIYSNYSQQELELVQKEADEFGMSLSAFQKYRTLLHLTDQNQLQIPQLIAMLHVNLQNHPAGVPFIVATLMKNVWPTLTRSQKITLAKELSKTVKNDPAHYVRIKVFADGTSQYKKL